jgi:para-aminobenzoate synthetase component 1
LFRALYSIIKVILDTSFCSFYVADYDEFKNKLIIWASQFPDFIFLDSNHYSLDPYSKYDFVMGIDVLDQYIGTWDLDTFKEWLSSDSNMVLGYMGYGKRDQHTASNQYEHHADNHFWIKPRYLIYGKDQRVFFQRNYPEAIAWMDAIRSVDRPIYKPVPLSFVPKTEKSVYVQNVQKIKERIQDGDFYEMNYCVQFEAKECQIDPIAYFIHKNNEAKAPMSAFVKKKNNYIMSFMNYSDD